MVVWLDSKIDSEARSFLAAITQQTIASLHLDANYHRDRKSDDDTNTNLEEIKGKVHGREEVLIRGLLQIEASSSLPTAIC